MIGLIGAMAVEMDGLMAKVENPQKTQIGMDTFVSGKLFGRDAVLAVCGPGKVNAALCALEMILHFQPEWVLNMGVAGAGDDDVEIGDMVIASSLVQHDCDTSPIGDPVGMVSKINLVNIPVDEQLRIRLEKAAMVLDDANVLTGVVATGDQFIGRGEVRALIHERFSAKAVEMEGGAVAHACYMHGVPCGVIRSISDKANGQSEMDYPTFVQLAAAHSQKVVEQLLKEDAQ